MKAFATALLVAAAVVYVVASRAEDGGAAWVGYVRAASYGWTLGAAVGLAFVSADEMRELKRDHLGIDEATDALAFPIDGLAELPEGMPRQLGDVVVCLDVVGEAWRRPLVHALLHLVGYDHGSEMEAREAVYAP